MLCFHNSGDSDYTCSKFSDNVPQGHSNYICSQSDILRNEILIHLHIFNTVNCK